jgi:transcription termination factor Rho
MSVLDRSALESSPLADLHAIASELSIDGYRRLRKAALVDLILERQGGESAADGEPAADALAPDTESSDAPVEAEAEAVAEPESDTADDLGPAPEEEETASPRRRRGRRGGRGRAAREETASSRVEETEPADAAEAPADGPAGTAASDDDDELVEGVVELLANGSGFVRVDPPEPSDEDVYISSAQVKRCELVSGDRVTGPKRAPRRSERFASLIRIETINGRPASELADQVRFEDLPAAFPSRRIELGSEHPTLQSIDALTPIGLGSRVTICGAPRSGKSVTLRAIAAALAGRSELEVSVVLAGVRPEEITEWSDAEPAPLAAVSFAASDEGRNAAVEPAVDQVRRLAARGADAVLLIDTLDGCGAQLVRKAMASARDIVGGGSVTVIATAAAPLGGETTTIALDGRRAALGEAPGVDLIVSGTMRPERLVGEDGAAALAQARRDAGAGAGER